MSGYTLGQRLFLVKWLFLSKITLKSRHNHTKNIMQTDFNVTKAYPRSRTVYVMSQR